MPATLDAAPARFTWFHATFKGVAVVASTGAAVASIVTALHSNGLLGGSRASANGDVAWVRLTPAIDTATAIGDTIPFAAMIADRNGGILAGAVPVWTTGDSGVAVVTHDGSVVARGTGLTTVNVVVGRRVASARILVRQQVAAVALSDGASDSALVVPEGSQVTLHARALDARGHAVPGRPASWTIDDTVVAGIDPGGVLLAQSAGRGVVSVHVDGVAAQLPVTVSAAASALAVASGNDQRSLAGHPLPQQIVVRATNRRGAPAPGQLVTFRLRGLEGRVEPLTATTDADGRARAEWTLGDDPGAQALLVSVQNVDSATVVTAEAEPVAANTRVTALQTALRARAGTTLADSVGVRLTDSAGRALVGVPVRWSAPEGTAEAIDARTDTAGVARARWTLATRTGTQRLRAFVGTSASRIAPAEIITTALAGPVAGMVVVSGDHQRDAVGRRLGAPIVLRVADAAGNGAAGAAVTLTPSAGSVSDTTMSTDSLGLVKVRWTLGHAAGTQSLVARTAGVTRVLRLAALATPARAANLSFDDAPPTRRGHARVKRLVAVVTDIYGNPVPDAPLTFSTKHGAVSPARAVSDAHGRVALSWTMGTAGTSGQTLKGAVRGTDVTGAYLVASEQSDAVRTAALHPGKVAR